MKLSILAQAVSASALFFLFITSSCTNDSLPEVPDPDLMGCDTTNISFSAVITPILEQNCYNGCHSGSNPTSGFLLDSYAGVNAKVEDGRLLGAVEQLIGFVAMPLGKAPIPDCEISQIRIWIEMGAKDN